MNCSGLCDGHSRRLRGWHTVLCRGAGLLCTQLGMLTGPFVAINLVGLRGRRWDTGVTGEGKLLAAT